MNRPRTRRRVASWRLPTRRDPPPLNTSRGVAGWLGVLLVAALVVPCTASAHGGKRIVTRDEGPYRVALDALAVQGGQTVTVVDYTAYLTDRRTGDPVDDARVTVVVETPGRTLGPLA